MKLLTVADVAEQLQLCRSQVYAIKGDIHYVKLGGAVRFRPEDVARYVQENLLGRQSAPSPARKLTYIGHRKHHFA